MVSTRTPSSSAASPIRNSTSEPTIPSADLRCHGLIDWLMRAGYTGSGCTCKIRRMSDAGDVPAWTSMTAEQAQRWDQFRGIAAAIAPGPRFVVVDGHRNAPVFVERLAPPLADPHTLATRQPRQSDE